ncbi:LuxR C-terminal-related transcriptional regulator [Chloroflexota bacterium]
MDTNILHEITEENKLRKLTIFIVDNQPLYRQAIRQVLQEDMEMVGESALTANIWSDIESLSPDIALVDVGLPSLSGFGIARQIATRCPGVAVVMLSPSPDDDQLFQALKSGAVAFLNKDISADKLTTVLRKVGQGAYPINETLLSRPSMAKKVLHLFQNLSLMGKDIETLMTPLSPREMEILEYIAEGNSNKRIAYALGIGEQTIKNHITSIMRKLNANDRTHAVVLAMRKGWLNIEEALEIPEGEELVASP